MSNYFTYNKSTPKIFKIQDIKIEFVICSDGTCDSFSWCHDFICTCSI